MRVAFIGCVEFSYQALQQVMAQPGVELVGVVTRHQSAFNADFRSLEPLAAEAGASCYLAQGNDQQAMASWLRECRPDVVYCFGWSYLLGSDILQIPPLGVVGYHPAALPKNRGRHPIIWALALGLQETASTFFFMDEGADSGDILSQVPVTIEAEDDAATLYQKLVEMAKAQIARFTRELADGHYPRIRQDHRLANYWRKRSKPDGLIDWRMAAQSIYNLVRALTRPYVGAHCLYRGEERKVWRSECRPLGGEFAHLEPGKVLALEQRQVVVKCGEDAIVLTEHELDPLPQEGDYL